MNIPAASSTDTARRWHGLDAVRALALLLGVVLHTTMSFLPGAQYFWVVADNASSPVAAAIFFVIHNFRLITFFLLAGFFARMSFHRLGLKQFARDRWRRIATPLLVAWPLIFSAIVAVLVWQTWLKTGGHLPKEAPPGPRFSADDFPLTHLWFLYALSLFYIAAIALRFFIATVDKRQGLRHRIDAIVRFFMRRGAPLYLASPMALALFYCSPWYAWFGVPTPDHSLYLNIPSIVAFGSAFALGWCLHRQSDLLFNLREHYISYLLIAIACTIFNLMQIGVSPALVAAKPSITSAIYAFSYGVAAWSWSFALIGAALRFLSRFNNRLRYLADASYWVYLIHLPLVMAFQVIATQLAWHWALECSAILLSVVALSLTSYHFWVRDSFIGATLNGQRVPADVSNR